MADSTLKERTARGLFWGGLAGGLQQVLTFVIGIVLARHLLPSDYGMVAMLTVFSVLVSNLMDSGFTSAIAVKKSVSDDDYNAVLRFSVIVGLVFYVILYFCAPAIAKFNNTPELTVLARVSFLGFIVSSLGIPQSAYMFRNLMVKQRTMSTLIAVATGGVVGIAFVLNGYAYWGLVAQDLTYKVVVVVMYWVFSPWRPSRGFNMRPVVQMFGFSSKILATNILHTLNSQLLQAILGHFFPRHEVGLYSQAYKWNSMGFSLIATTVSSVAQPVLARAGEQQRQKRVFRKMLRFTAFFSFPAMLGIAIIAPEFIPLALKDQWLECVPYLQTLCLAGAVEPLSHLYSNLLVSRGRSTAFFIVTASMVAMQMVIIIATYILSGTVQQMLYGIVALYLVWFIIWHLTARKDIGLSFAEMLKDTLPFALAAAASMAVAWGASMLTPSAVLKLAVKIVVAACTYCVIMHVSKAVIYRECVDFVKQKIARRGKAQG